MVFNHKYFIVEAFLKMVDVSNKQANTTFLYSKETSNWRSIAVLAGEAVILVNEKNICLHRWANNRALIWLRRPLICTQTGLLSHHCLSPTRLPLYLVYLRIIFSEITEISTYTIGQNWAKYTIIFKRY